MPKLCFRQMRGLKPLRNTDHVFIISFLLIREDLRLVQPATAAERVVSLESLSKKRFEVKFS